MADDDKPYEGARGPRKTKPKPQRAKVLEGIDNVRELFGEDEAEAVNERRGTQEKLPKGTSKRKGPGRVEGLTDRQKRRGKVRIGKRFTEALDRMVAEGMTMAEFVKELSPEELARGMLKDKNGNFTGPPPKWVPGEFHKECVRELIRRGKTLYQENYLQAIQAMTVIATNESVEPKDRIRAAQFVIERIEGKVPDKLEVGVSEPWQDVLIGIVASAPPDTPVREFGGGEPAGDE